MTHVREGRPADRHRLFAIQSTALTEPWPDLLALALEGPPTLLVAVPGDGSTPAGYALAVLEDDDDGPKSETSADERDPSGPVGYLVELAVAPGERGQGYGTALVEAVAARFREAGASRLRVTARLVDDRALSFYRASGFERRERLPDHYESGDGVLLVRDLDGADG